MNDDVEYNQMIIQALEMLRTARNNMSKEDYLFAVMKSTMDANIAMPLIEASSQVSIRRLQQNIRLDEIFGSKN